MFRRRMFRMVFCVVCVLIAAESPATAKDQTVRARQQTVLVDNRKVVAEVRNGEDLRILRAKGAFLRVNCPRLRTDGWVYYADIGPVLTEKEAAQLNAVEARAAAANSPDRAFARGDFKAALSGYQTLLDTKMNLLGFRSPNDYEWLLRKAECLSKLGDHARAGVAAREALDFVLEIDHFFCDWPQSAHRRNPDLPASNADGNTVRSLERIAKALALFQATVRTPDLLVSEAERLQWTGLSKLGRHGQARAAALRTRDRFNEWFAHRIAAGDKNAELSKRHRHLIFDISVGLAALADEEGRHRDALSQFHATMAFAREQFVAPSESHYVGHCLNSLGIDCVRFGFNDIALDHFRAARDVFQKAGEGYHDSLMRMHCDVARILGRSGKYQDMADEAKKAINVFTNLPPNSEVTAANIIDAYQLSATALAQLGPERSDEAKLLFGKALQYCSNVDERERMHEVVVQTGYCGFLIDTGRPEEARSRLKDAAKSLQASRDLWNRNGAPDGASTELELGLGVHLARLGEWDSAATLFNRHRRVARAGSLNVSGYLPPLAQQVVFARVYQPELNNHLTLAWHAGDNREVVEMTAAWIMNGKGVVDEALAIQERAVRQVPEGDELRAVREELSFLAFQEKTEKEFRQRIRDLCERQDVIVSDLANRFVNVDDLQMRGWTDLSELRAVLNAQQVLIEFARVEQVEWKKSPVRNSDARYGAWVIPALRGGEVQFVDLGPTNKIDEAIRVVRKNLENAPQEIEFFGTRKSEETIRRQLRDLSKLLFDPLLKHIKDKRELVFSPDSLLGLIPFSALVLPDDRYVVEEFVVSEVLSGRDLAPYQAPLANSAAPVMFGDPDFDAEVPVSALVAARKVPVGKIKNATRLRHGQADLQAIGPKFKAISGEDAVTYQQSSATEESLRNVASPDVLVISTHGFFFPGEGALGFDAADGKDRTVRLQQALSLERAMQGKLIEHPLLRSGLLLAGANHYEKGAAGRNDGIVTALEVLSLKLAGTRLVVLGACSTGVGDVQSGEGIAGLRQAFHVAGARAVLAALWDFPDDLGTSLLVSEFLRQWAEEDSGPVALRKTQLERIHALRQEKDKVAHPFFWAGFSLTNR